MVIKPQSAIAQAIAVIDVMPPLGDIEPACACLVINGHTVYIDRFQLEELAKRMEAANA